MTEEQFERFLCSIESIARSLELRLKKEFPDEKPKIPAEIFRPDDDRREQFNDRPSEEWLEETESRLPSRFQAKFDESHPRAKTLDRP